MHGREDGGVLSHTQVIVGAPHCDLARPAGVTMGGAGEGPGVTLQIGKYTVPSFAMEFLKLPAEMGFVVHVMLQSALNG
jgi:hypothetical protein